MSAARDLYLSTLYRACTKCGGEIRPLYHPQWLCGVDYGDGRACHEYPIAAELDEYIEGEHLHWVCGCGFEFTSPCKDAT